MQPGRGLFGCTGQPGGVSVRLRTLKHQRVSLASVRTARAHAQSAPAKLSWTLTMHRRKLLTCTMAAAAALASPALLRAQARPIRIVVPFAPGGPIDVTARLLAEAVRDSLGTVVIENRPGAGGNIGVAAVAKAAPDGLTLGIATTASHAINPWLYTKLPYDPDKDFVGITQMLRVPNVLVVNADVAQRLNLRSLADLVAYAKANPAKLSYGSGGNGSAGHLAGELFKSKHGIFAVHIPYAGGNPAQLALLSGQVDFNFDNLATAAPNIRSGKLRALAVTTAKRSAVMPEVPAMAETVPGFEIDTWWGLMAPAGTAPEVVAKLNQAFVAALQSADVKSRFANLMAEPAPSTPQQFEEFLGRERLRYQAVVKLSGAKVE
jgi:tripartite-type tricarboxylate transporter receptor subunit TctC